VTAFVERYGPWALVAGASEGIGAAFAVELARRGLKLLLVARRTEPLAALAQELRQRHHVEVETAALDLGRPDLASAVDALIAGRELGLVVYNAASSHIGDFLSTPLDAHLATVDVNCRGPLVLAHLLGQRMAARGRGGIVLMSSMAASQGSPLVASYAATKAFNLVLGESLWEELRSRGVDVLAARAGATRTPNYERTQPAGKVPMQDPSEVAVEALLALGRAPSHITGRINRLAGFFMSRILSRRQAVLLMGRETRKLYGGRSP
jgi:short-subunit dehydrogenase